jgi:diguanylate cyclase (GGDEF)-like protein/PAS domain S-box-containing protein
VRVLSGGPKRPPHALLARQLRRVTGAETLEGLDEQALRTAMSQVLEVVSATYAAADEERSILEHSLDETSAELVAHNTRLRKDLDLLRELEASLRNNQSRLDFQRERMPLGLVEWDASGRVTEWNPAAERLFGWTRQEMLGKTSTARIVPAHARPETEAVVARLRSGTGGSHNVNANLRKDGIEIRCEWFSTTLFDNEGNPTGVASLVRDVTERVRWEEQLVRASRHDGLTGLPNRRFFIDAVDRGLSRHRRQDNLGFALLFIDLDRFKDVNDSKGHAVGDGLLKAIALRLEELVRGEDLVARLGGDEFAIMLDRVEETREAVHAAERIGDALRRPFIVDGAELTTTASIGVALASQRVATAEEMIRDADIAMYQAKVSGRARTTLFDSAMYEEALLRIQLEDDLRHASRRNQLRLVYQPIVDLRTGGLSGFEALLRWDHPTRGAVSPAEFIPIAEDSGSIIEIGAWVVHAAVAQLGAWRSELPENCYVSVNISPRQLLQPDLPEMVADAMAAHGVKAQRLCVEITETSMLKGPRSRRALESLRALGIRVFMDDFGTGYASLANLVAYEVDMVKIDRTFVNRTHEHGPDFLRSILLLTSSLGKATVAEGIEDADELEMVRSLGTNYGQGYYLGRPMDASAVPAWRAEHEARSWPLGDASINGPSRTVH